MSVKEHYDSHLGNFYEWMAGDFDSGRDSQEQYFRAKGIKTENGIAIDLGSGHGFQSIALANLGYSVKAVDFNQQLLDSLGERKANLPIELFQSDILSYLKDAPSADLIVCMGDTLAHLLSFEELEQLFRILYQKLVYGGQFICSFRDYQFELKEEQRFIPVRADENRIHTCFLEYQEDKVIVSDLLHEKEGGIWKQKVSSYPKLRLSKEGVIDLLNSCGFQVLDTDEIRRMHYVRSAK
ncbi:MAG: class I SAM-dependent methyltransferase [Bacteroidota bacterium]